MMDLTKLKYASQLQEGAGLPTCVQVIVPAVDGSFSYHATNQQRELGKGTKRAKRFKANHKSYLEALTSAWAFFLLFTFDLL